jgi:hypothetical protein
MGVAVDALIANLNGNRTAEGNQPIRADVDFFTAALQEIVAALPATPAISAPVTGGRLTLTTAVPVLSADVVAATTIFFALYNGNKTLINSGVAATGFVPIVHGELSQTLADATKSPAAAAANSVYDIFVWNDAGTIRCTRGLAWTNATTRAAALTRINGILVNAVAVTNGPGAELGTYVGTIATDATPDCSMMFAPAAAAGGSVNRLDVWNMYNRVNVSSTNIDSTATWAYDGLAFRAKNNNQNNAIIFVVGLSEDPISVSNIAQYSASATTTSGAVSIGLDSTTARHDACGNNINTFTAAGNNGANADLVIPAPLGSHFVCPIEQGFNGVGNVDWIGTNLTAGSNRVAAFSLQMRM